MIHVLVSGQREHFSRFQTQNSNSMPKNKPRKWSHRIFVDFLVNIFEILQKTTKDLTFMFSIGKNCLPPIAPKTDDPDVEFDEEFQFGLQFIKKRTRNRNVRLAVSPQPSQRCLWSPTFEMSVDRFRVLDEIEPLSSRE